MSAVDENLAKLWPYTYSAVVSARQYTTSVQLPEQKRCPWCHGETVDDSRGHCSGCGGPREEARGGYMTKGWAREDGGRIHDDGYFLVGDGGLPDPDGLTLTEEEYDKAWSQRLADFQVMAGMITPAQAEQIADAIAERLAHA